MEKMESKPGSKSKKAKYDCTRDIYDAMAESTIYKDYSGKGDFQITDAHTYVKSLYIVELFVKDVLASSADAFDITHDRNGNKVAKRLRLGRYFINLYYAPGSKSIESTMPVNRPSPNVCLYFDTLAILGIRFTDLNKSDSKGKLQAEYFNEFVELIRKNSKGKAYQDEQKQRRKQAADNHKSLTKYIKALFDENHYSQLYVVRMDLGYLNDDKNPVSIDDASSHRDKFLVNRYHNKVFDTLVGYAWGLQYCAGKGGYYQHFFMFLERKSKPDNDWYAAISNYWSKITDEKGRCQNCEMGISPRFSYPGVGIVKRSDSDGFIQRAASYLTMRDIFFSLKYVNNLKKFRTFDRGNIPPKVQK